MSRNTSREALSVLLTHLQSTHSSFFDEKEGLLIDGVLGSDEFSVFFTPEFEEKSNVSRVRSWTWKPIMDTGSRVCRRSTSTITMESFTLLLDALCKFLTTLLEIKGLDGSEDFPSDFEGESVEPKSLVIMRPGERLSVNFCTAMSGVPLHHLDLKYEKSAQKPAVLRVPVGHKKSKTIITRQERQKARLWVDFFQRAFFNSDKVEVKWDGGTDRFDFRVCQAGNEEKRSIMATDKSNHDWAMHSSRIQRKV